MSDATPTPPTTLAQLRALSDHDLVLLYDRQAETMTKSASMYLDELGRRDRARTATWALRVSIVSLVAAAASLIVVFVDR